MHSLSTLTQVLQRIRQSGLIVRLRSDLAVAEQIEIGDALLAAPILVVEIPLDAPEGPATLAEFHRRYGDHLLIGAAQVTDRELARIALTAGAHYLAAPLLDPPTLHFAQSRQTFYLPLITTVRAMASAQRQGCSLVAAPQALWQTGGPSTPAHVTWAPQDATAVTLAAQAGAVGIYVQDLLLPTPQWSSAALITAARWLRRAWET
ncbi:MAG: hypothetical protein R3C14_52585 [Caldilineaceae bacterium]